MIERNLIEKSSRGVTAVQVASDLICSHSFVAYIDRNLVVRDNFACDFKVNLPEIEIKTGFEYDKNDLDLDIVRLNLIPLLLVKIITGITSGKKILILSKFNHINKHFKQFFN